MRAFQLLITFGFFIYLASGQDASFVMHLYDNGSWHVAVPQRFNNYRYNILNLVKSISPTVKPEIRLKGKFEGSPYYDVYVAKPIDKALKTELFNALWRPHYIEYFGTYVINLKLGDRYRFTMKDDFSRQCIYAIKPSDEPILQNAFKQCDDVKKLSRNCYPTAINEYDMDCLIKHLAKRSAS